ncbi:Uncharacterised protein [uncultured archaeon]|nr:Uncharacterised protein [uncultured archaeon]
MHLSVHNKDGLCRAWREKDKETVVEKPPVKDWSYWLNWVIGRKSK